MKTLRALALLALLLPVALFAQATWTTRNPAPFTTSVKATAASPSLYVAVTEHGGVATSADGLTWQLENFPSIENLNNVAFANGHFFARGDSGTIYVSDDGHYWLQRYGGGATSGYGPTGRNIVYGNGTYVVVSSSSSYAGILTSTDAVTFTVQPTVLGSHVAFGGGLFVLTSTSSSSPIKTSPDGVTWTELHPSEFSYVSEVTYGAGRFVIRSGSKLYQSTDTAAWTEIAVPTVSSIAFVKDRFIATKTSDGLPIVSLDGLAWTIYTSATITVPPGQIAGLGAGFVGFSGSRLYFSPDAATWTTSGTYFTTTSYSAGVAFAQDRFLTGDGYRSVDGITWTKTGFAVPVAGATDLIIRAANDRFFAFTGSSIYTSLDGTSGSKTADLSFQPKSVAFGAGRYVAVGSKPDRTTGAIATSADALTWTERTSPLASGTLPALAAVAYAANQFVAVGTTGAIYSSPDGLAWTPRPHVTTSTYAYDIAYGAGRWVIAGTPSLTSTDAITWVNADLPDAFAVAFANGTFLLSVQGSSPNNFSLRPYSGLATSPDGLHWTHRPLTASYGTAAFGHDTWVVVNGNGTVSQSSAVNASLAPAFATGLTATLDPADSSRLTLDAPASGAGPISYQWYRDGTTLAGATSSTLLLPNWISTAGNTYTLVATNTHGSALTAYRLSNRTTQLDPAPSANNTGITRSASLSADGQITLSLEDYYGGRIWFGPAPFTYQWYKDGLAIPDSDFPSITLPYAATTDADSIFTLKLTNLFGSVSFDIDLQPTAITTNRSPTLTPGAYGWLSTQVTVPVAGNPVTFTWKKNGQVVRTYSTTGYNNYGNVITDWLNFSSFSAGDYGLYQVTVSNAFSTISTDYFDVSPPPVTRLVNLSVRAHVGTGDDVLIAGCVGSGSSAGPNLLARGIGPTLSTLGVSSPLLHPRLVLNDSNGTTLVINDRWDVQVGYEAAFLRDLMSRLGAFALPAASADAAILRPGALNTSLPPRFTAVLSGAGDTTGVGLIEFYESAASAQRLVNLSARARVGTGENVLIAGFVVAGEKPIKLLIRGVGPTLAKQGVTSPLANPKIILYNSDGLEIHNNDQWNEARNLADLRAATAATGAFALNEGSSDAAMLETLAPGVYSVHVTSVGATSGVALVEIYEAP